jgi:hypothetical protein|tara:strand:+ start:837 stop:1559 length:723 start_codon:yes stop_codon:yes gene_type:complete
MIVSAYYGAMKAEKIVAAIKGVGFEYTTDGSYLTVNDAQIDRAMEKHKAVFQAAGRTNLAAKFSYETKLRNRDSLRLKNLAKQPGFEWVKGHSVVNAEMLAVFRDLVGKCTAQGGSALANFRVPKVAQMSFTGNEMRRGGRAVNCTTEAMMIRDRKAKRAYSSGKRARKSAKRQKLNSALMGEGLKRVGTKSNGGTVRWNDLSAFESGEKELAWAVEVVRMRRRVAQSVQKKAQPAAAAQ